MIAKMIEGVSRVLGKSQGYIGLPVRDELTADGAPFMVTHWEPTPAELERIASGAPVVVHLFGTIHPPIRVGVGKAPQALK